MIGGLIFIHQTVHLVEDERNLTSINKLLNKYIYYQIVHEVHKRVIKQLTVHQQSLGLKRDTSNHFVQKSTRAQLWLRLQREDLIYKKLMQTRLWRPGADWGKKSYREYAVSGALPLPSHPFPFPLVPSLSLIHI